MKREISIDKTAELAYHLDGVHTFLITIRQKATNPEFMPGGAADKLKGIDDTAQLALVALYEIHKILTASTRQWVGDKTSR